MHQVRSNSRIIRFAAGLLLSLSSGAMAKEVVWQGVVRTVTKGIQLKAVCYETPSFDTPKAQCFFSFVNESDSSVKEVSISLVYWSSAKKMDGAPIYTTHPIPAGAEGKANKECDVIAERFKLSQMLGVVRSIDGKVIPDFHKRHDAAVMGVRG